MPHEFKSLDSTLAAEHQLAWGGFNDFPAGWHQVSEKDFVQNGFFFRYTPEVVEYRQMYPTDESGRRQYHGKYTDAKLFFYHDGTGLGIGSDWWEETVQYYAFGCCHEYVVLTPQECKERGIAHHGNCWHVRECHKCNYIDSYDSSD